MTNLKFLVPVSKIVQPARMQSVARVNALLLNVPRVQIAKGKNQYLLMAIYMHGKSRFGRTIVRGDVKKSHGKLCGTSEQRTSAPIFIPLLFREDF